jgi:hypothetical protein
MKTALFIYCEVLTMAEKFEFKKLSETETVETVSDSATVLVEDGGVIKRTPKAQIGTVKTVNGVEPDETGDVKIAIDGDDVITQTKLEAALTEFESNLPEAPQQVQGDLTQNDSEAPDYVNGRTHWVEMGESIEVFPETTVTTSRININMPIVEGATYIVTWNGIDYTCVAELKVNIGEMQIGNHEPFTIQAKPGAVYTSVTPWPSEESPVVIKIVMLNEIVHKIDKKYLPDGAAVGAKGTGEFAEIFNDYYGNTASGEYSHSEGHGTTASGKYSHSEGDITTASGEYSHSEGHYTTASGAYSHSEGEGTTASGKYSHSEGYRTTASNSGSHAEGNETTAVSAGTHAEGCGTIAKGVNQHVQGMYNIEDVDRTYAHIVGNGETSSKRSNAHTLDWDGNAWYQGTVECTAVIMKSPGGKRFKITVDDSGTISATEITE